MARRIAFRVDASVQIGTGHVMRCLTLADALTSQGDRCVFICREHTGNLIGFIRSKGYLVHALKVEKDVDTQLPHGLWLGSSQSQDYSACLPALIEIDPDLVVVDHYALDYRWEKLISRDYRRLIVIDDLADRHHVCQMLIDQTFGRSGGDYHSFVPPDCTLLCGSEYALLRPDFFKLRNYSLNRRANAAIKSVLVSMGGVDKDNLTGKVIDALRNCSALNGSDLTVVLGPGAIWEKDVRVQLKDYPISAVVLSDVKNMAELMAESDLAIGAAGATSWERCCLGLPTILLVIAENQRTIGRALSALGAAWVCERSGIDSNLPLILETITRESLRKVSDIASKVTDGFGVSRVIQLINAKYE